MTATEEITEYRVNTDPMARVVSGCMTQHEADMAMEACDNAGIPAAFIWRWADDDPGQTEVKHRCGVGLVDEAENIRKFTSIDSLQAYLAGRQMTLAYDL